MKLTNKSEYALLALAYLSRKSRSEFTQATEIAGAQSIPKSFLHQILLTLQRAGIVQTKKGKLGGYCLAREASVISVAEVVRLFDGALAPTTSSSKHFYASSPVEKEKKLLKLFSEIRELIATRLEKTYLSDL